MGAISNHTHRTGDGSLFCGTDGNVIADERNQYTYDSHGQLIRVSGADESSYTYDSRGNLLSKTEDGIPVQYAYTNAQWPDQVTAVDGVALTYDQVGNLTGYGARQYNWARGKLLESVTDEQGSYTYTYDADGYRATKVTANGKTTFDTIGGQLLAQAGPEGNLYFQYSGGTPFGFVLDDIQYYYLTNLNGDVVGITDAQGNLLAQYVYDPWGKLLQINTTEPDNADQLAVATANPLRYRGYYYDSETCMYYLQSRYYDPDLGRFISADDFDCLTTSNFFSVNAYAYCWNNPIAFKDSEGNTPNLALAYANIKAFLVDVNGKIVEKLEAKKQKFLEKLQERVENLKAKFDEAKEKAKYYLKNPDVFASKIASRIAGHEVTVRFPLLELLKGIRNVAEALVSIPDTGTIRKIARYTDNRQSDDSNEGDDRNIWMAIFQALGGGIVLHALDEALKSISLSLDELWNKSIKGGWNDFFQEILKTGITTFTVITNNVLQPDNGKTTVAAKGAEKLFNKMIKSAEEIGESAKLIGMGKAGLKGFQLIYQAISFTDGMEGAKNGLLDEKTEKILSAISCATGILSIFLVDVPGSSLISIVGDNLPRIIAIRIFGGVIC